MGGCWGASGAPKGTVGDPRATLGGLCPPLGGLEGPKSDEAQNVAELAGGKCTFYAHKTVIFKEPQGRPRGGPTIIG